jgi:peptide/nickel transport system substrate-binding protein
VLTAQPGSIAAPSVIEDVENGGQNPVGTGPFRFVSRTRDNNLVVEKNPDYWRTGFPLLDRIEFRIITDAGARGAALQSGDIDAMESSEADLIEQFFDLAKQGDYQIYFADDGDTDEAFVMFNTTKQPFDDPVLRKAAIQAIDTVAVNDQVYNGLFTPARGPLAPTSEWFHETDYPDYDPAAAKAEIEAWEERNGRPMGFKANIPPDPAVLEIAQLMKDLAGDVGVDVELNTMEQTVLILEAITGNYESTGFGQIFNVPHPDRMYPFLHSSSIPDDPLSNTPSLNFARYANGAIDEALDAARATDDPDEQREHYNALQEALAADTPYLWLVHLKSSVVARNLVRSLTTWTLPDGAVGKPQLGAQVQLWQVWLDQNES